MSTNDTAGMRAGILVMGYDPRTASLTVQVLSNSGGFEAASDGTAVRPGRSDAQAGTDPAVALTGWARPVCAASVQHNFRAGRHPGRCQPGRKITR
jgi:hypothetical protein